MQKMQAVYAYFTRMWSVSRSYNVCFLFYFGVYLITRFVNAFQKTEFTNVRNLIF